MLVACPHCGEEFQVSRTAGIRRRWQKEGPTVPGSPLFKTYRSWQAMKRRCDSPKDSFYAKYGGRGITYDPRWETFEGFLADMGPRPDGMTLDRIDNDGNYEPGNCRWATRSEQRRNRPQPRGWKQRPLTAPRAYGTKTITCTDCGTAALVLSVVSKWRCPEHRAEARRATTARYRAKSSRVA